jgi:drug/metabolite transporter (DMT)-like permease
MTVGHRSVLADRPSARDLVFMGVAVMAVSTAAPLIRGADAPTLAVAFWRTALALPVTGAVLLARHRPELTSLSTYDTRRSALAGLFLAGHFATWVPSLSYTAVASSVALVSTQPVWAVMIASRRGAHVPRATKLGIGLALGGVVLLTGVDLSISARALFGDLLALTGGVLAAFYVTTGADVRSRVSTATYATLCYGAASIVLLTICVVGGQAVAGYPATTWLLLVALMVGPQLLGHTLLNRLLRTTGATIVSVAILFEIVGAAALAWLFFGEIPPLSALPAGLLLSAGIVTVIRAGNV